MNPFQNHFTKAHGLVFLGIWLGFTALTYWIAEHGIQRDSHRRLVNHLKQLVAEWYET